MRQRNIWYEYEGDDKTDEESISEIDIFMDYIKIKDKTDRKLDELQLFDEKQYGRKGEWYVFIWVNQNE